MEIGYARLVSRISNSFVSFPFLLGIQFYKTFTFSRLFSINFQHHLRDISQTKFPTCFFMITFRIILCSPSCTFTVQFLNCFFLIFISFFFQQSTCFQLKQTLTPKRRVVERLRNSSLASFHSLVYFSKTRRVSTKLPGLARDFDNGVSTAGSGNEGDILVTLCGLGFLFLEKNNKKAGRKVKIWTGALGGSRSKEKRVILSQFFITRLK